MSIITTNCTIRDFWKEVSDCMTIYGCDSRICVLYDDQTTRYCTSLKGVGEVVNDLDLSGGSLSQVYSLIGSFLSATYNVSVSDPYHEFLADFRRYNYPDQLNHAPGIQALTTIAIMDAISDNCNLTSLRLYPVPNLGTDDMEHCATVNDFFGQIDIWRDSTTLFLTSGGSMYIVTPTYDEQRTFFGSAELLHTLMIECLDGKITLDIPYETAPYAGPVQGPLCECVCPNRSAQVQKMIDALEYWKSPLDVIDLFCSECKAPTRRIFARAYQNFTEFTGGSAGAMVCMTHLSEQHLREVINQRRLSRLSQVARGFPKTRLFRKREGAIITKLWPPKDMKYWAKPHPRKNRVPWEVVNLDRQFHGMFDNIIPNVTLNLGERERGMFASFINKIQFATETVQETARETVSSIFDGMKDLMKTIFKEIAIVLAIIAILYLAWKFGWGPLAFGGALFILGSYIGFNLTRLIWWLIEKCFPDNDENEVIRMLSSMGAENAAVFPDERQHHAESGFDLLNVANMAIFGVASFAFLRVIPSDKDSMDFMKKCSFVPKAISGVTDLILQFKSGYEWFVKFALHNLLGQEAVPDGGLTDVSNWLCEIEAMMLKGNFDAIKNDKEKAEKAIDLYLQGVQFEREKHRMVKPAVDKLMCGMRCAWKLYEAGTQSPVFTNNNRPRPPCVLLRGGTAVGKTTMLDFLASDVLVRACGISIDQIEKNGSGAYIYNRNPTQDFWDGYDNMKKVCIYDDFGQLKDSVGNPNPEWFEVIHCANGFVYNLHMADLGAKASTRFVSELMLLTSNLKKMSCNSLHETSAITSRLSHIYDIQVKPEFLKLCSDGIYRIDRSKACPNGEALNLDIYRIVRQQVENDVFVNVPGAKEIDFYQLCDELVDAVNDSKRQHVALDGEKQQFLGRVTGGDLAKFLRNRPGRRAYIQNTGSAYPTEAERRERIVNTDRQHHMHWPWQTEQKKEELVAVVQKTPDGYTEAVWTEEENEVVLRGWARRWRDTQRDVLNRIQNAPTWQKILALGSVLALISIAAGTLFYRKIKKRSVSNVALKINGADDATWTQPLFVAACRNFTPFRIWRKKEEDLRDCTLVCATQQGDSVEVSARELAERAALREYHADYSPERDSKRDQKQRRRHHQESPTAEHLWSAVFNSGATEKDPMIFDKNIELIVDGEKAEKAYVLDEQDMVIETVKSEIVVPRPGGVTERAFHSQETEDLSMKVKKNMVTVGWELDGQRRDLGLATFVRGTVAVMPYHFVTFLRERSGDYKMYMRAFGQTDPQYINPKDVLEGRRIGEKKDLWMFDARLASSRRDITKAMIDQKDLDKLAKTRVRLVTREKGTYNDYNVLVLKEGTAHYTEELMDPVYTKMPDGTIREGESFLSAVVTDIVTTTGQCGGVLLVDNNFIRGKICGLLSVGDGKKTSECAPLYKEEVLECLRHFREHHGYVAMGEPEKVEIADVNLPIDGAFVVEGTAVPVFHPPKTTLETTEIFDLVHKNDVLPSVLRRTMDKETDIAFKGLKKNAVPRLPLDRELLAECAADVERVLFTCQDTHCVPVRRVLTFAEAIEGIEGEEFIKAIKRSSSAGYPYCKEMARGKGGKTTWFGNDEDFRLNEEPAKAVKAHVNTMIERAKEGVRSEAIFIDTAKDELRPFEVIDGKQVVKKTRMFAAGPMHLIILARMYCLGFMDFIQKNRIHNGIAVGINPCSSEWHELARRMKKFDCVVAGDFSDYDGNIHLELMQAAFDIVDRWYDDGPENSQIRRTICAMISQSQHLLDGIVYDWDHSQPSGQPFTAPINSVINLIIMRMAWRMVTGLSLIEYNRQVIDMTYGDDNLLSMSETTHEIFNQMAISTALSTIGMTYTDEAKSGDLTQKRRLEDVEFLKRRFVWREDMQQWTAPLNIRSIGRALNWRRAGPDPEGVLASSISSSLRELSLHPKQVYDEYYRKILKHTPSSIMARVETEPNYSAWARFHREGRQMDRRWFMMEEFDRQYHMESEEASSGAVAGENDPSANVGRVTEGGQETASTSVKVIAEGKGEDGQMSQLTPQETTVFHHEKKPTEFHYISHGKFERKFAEMLSSCVRDYTNVEITNFLRTPVKVGQVSWTTATDSLLNHKQPDLTTQVANPLFAFSHPKGLISSPMINMKLQQMCYFRADMVVRVVMNAQPFQCGALRLTGVVPLPNRKTSFDFSCMTTYTSQPGITHNLTSGEQQIDFRLKPLGPRLYWGLTTDWSNERNTEWMEFNLHALTPLRDPQGTGKVEITIFAWYENVDIRFRSGLPLAIKPATARITPTVNPDYRNMRYERQHHMEESEQQQKGGSISGTCQSLAKTADMFSMIPGVGQYAQMASSTLSTVGGIAAAMGHSKPTSKAVLTKSQLFQANDSLTMDGEFLGHQLGAMQINAIETGATAGSGVDEMALGYLMKQPAILDSFQVSDSAIPGTQLYSMYVSPQQYWYTGSSPGTYVFAAPPLTMGLLPFQFWAGSIVVELEIMKTQYHSGSLELIFVPQFYETSLPTTVDPDTCFRQIWDYSKSRTFKFVCPYVNHRQWLRVLSLGEEAYSVAPTVNEYNSGMLYIRVLNTMTTSAVVSGTIDVIMTVLPGDDFRYGGITSCQSMPWDGFRAALSVPVRQHHMEEQTTGRFNTPASGPSQQAPKLDKAGKTALKASLQKIDGLGNGVERTFMPHLDEAPHSALPLATTVGEGIFSIRQLIKRFSPVQIVTMTASSSNAAVLAVQPNPHVQTQADALDQLDPRRPDWINHFMAMYAVRSGGTRLIMSNTEYGGVSTLSDTTKNIVRMLPQNALWNDNSATYRAFAAPFIEGFGTGQWHGQTAGEQFVSLTQEGVLNAEVPMYSNCHVLWNEFSLSWKDSPPADTEPCNGKYLEAYVENCIPTNQVIFAYDPNCAGPNWSWNIMRAARDDFGLYIFSGCPMVHFYPSRVYTTTLPSFALNPRDSGVKLPIIPVGRQEQILEAAPRRRVRHIRALQSMFKYQPNVPGGTECDDPDCDDTDGYSLPSRTFSVLADNFVIPSAEIPITQP